MIPLQSRGIRGNWATLLLPIGTDDNIDYSRLADEIDLLTGMKVDGIYSNGTAGEFYNQTEQEFDEVNRILAEKCNAAGVPFQVGCSHMSPVISLERLKRAVALAPSAIQVILPDWFPPKMEETVSFLRKMQEASGDIGLVLYNPPHSKVRLSPSDFKTIREAGISLVGCKLPGGDAAWYKEMLSLNPGLSVFIPGHHLATGVRAGAHGAYSNVACLNPLTAQQWYDSMQTDMEGALELESRIQRFMNEQIVPYITQKGYSNQAVDKFLAAVGGWAEVGTRLRWPYKWISENEVEDARKICKDLLPEFFA
ncbi:dihydrodipicolinate synthase family protein [Chitinophaga sp. GCM10012297]|uniref:Dihydrodipicolinate synthase family protein n=1 Tax=Chitinophaga chungangae TaxID=2821488 RepID=A0ABS3Y9G6_9BACT|nr:dihydrodipicolinate synthase family protein [Chitinophaga chungangae]MBO9151291.1 dihydrodipicolinate synthase family protein [Chitinophaga chungangae]